MCKEITIKITKKAWKKIGKHFSYLYNTFVSMKMFSTFVLTFTNNKENRTRQTWQHKSNNRNRIF